MNFASGLNDGQNYIDSAVFPIELNTAEKKLREFYLDGNGIESFIQKIKDMNYKSLRPNFKISLKACAEKIAETVTDLDLYSIGIPKMPEKQRLVNEAILGKFIGNSCQLQRIRLELESLFLIPFFKRLLTRDLYSAKELNSGLSNYLQASLESLKLELDDPFRISDPSLHPLNYIKSEIPNIVKISSYLEKLALKAFLKESIEICRTFIEKKINHLFKADSLNRDEQLFGFAYKILLLETSDAEKYRKYFEKILPIGQILEELTLSWHEFPIQSKLSIYIYLYLIKSGNLQLLRMFPQDHEPIFPSNYTPESREELRKISKSYPIKDQTYQEINSIYIKSPFNWFKLIESVKLTQLPEIRPVLNSQDIKECIKNSSPGIFLQDKIMLETSQNSSLENISSPTSSHIIICVSGYLSQNSDHKELWTSLTKLYPHCTFYVFTWESSTTSTMIKSFASYFSFSRNFDESYSNSQVAGACLAELIMSESVFKNACISLIGFSLGTMVIYQCLACLSTVGKKVLHDVIFMGSAVPEAFKLDMHAIKENVVAGKLLNVTCKEDSILQHLFPIVSREKAFGTINVPGMERFEVHDIIKGHTDYRSKLKSLLST